MKFDLVVSNPPYTNSLDIKILKEILPIAEELIIVHPSTWALDIKGKSNTFNNFKTQINGEVKSLKFFNGNPIFGIGLFVPCMITHIDQNHNGPIDVQYFNENFKADSIFDITKFGTSWFDIVKPFKEKIESFILKNSNISSNSKIEIDDTKYHCQLAAIRGHVDKEKMINDDFYTLIMDDSDGNKGIRGDFKRKNNPMPTFEFITNNEQNNFIEYLKTDFVCFCLSLYKDGQNISGGGTLDLIPWLDFTQDWTNEKLFKYFDIDETTQNYIKSFLPDYYGIRGKQ